MSKGKKRRAFYFGLVAEVVVIFVLLLKGYRLIAWRYRTYVGEIDIVMRKRRQLVFVEC